MVLGHCRKWDRANYAVASRRSPQHLLPEVSKCQEVVSLIGLPLEQKNVSEKYPRLTRYEGSKTLAAENYAVGYRIPRYAYHFLHWTVY